MQADDDDVFQCGKCKKQFTSLARFMSHKKTRCVPAVVPLAQAPSNSQGLSPSPNTAFTPTVQQILPAQVRYLCNVLKEKHVAGLVQDCGNSSALIVMH